MNINSPSYGELLIQYHYAIMADNVQKIQEIKNQILDSLEANSGPITREEIECRGFARDRINDDIKNKLASPCSIRDLRP